MKPQVELTTNLPWLQLWIAEMVEEAEMTMRRAAKVLKKPTLAGSQDEEHRLADDVAAAVIPENRR